MATFYELKTRTIETIKKYLVDTEPENRNIKDLMKTVTFSTGLSEKFVRQILDYLNMKVNSDGLIESEV